MSQTMQYKSYYGSVEYSSEDRLLHGQLLGIRDMVIYDGGDVDTLETNFKGAVDEYLAFCKAEGRTPNVPFKGSFNVRVPQELHQRAAAYADEHDLKLNAVVQEALQEFLTHAE
jgi:predicted HicB family RNase H-like nuclease